VPARNEKRPRARRDQGHQEAFAGALSCVPVTIYSKSTACSKGHPVTLTFDWDGQRAPLPGRFSRLCPLPTCDGGVVGTLPKGADPSTLDVVPPVLLADTDWEGPVQP